MTMLGAAGMLVWFLWAGTQLAWAVSFVLMCFVVCLLITRFVAETGMPFFRIDGLNANMLMTMLPVSWLGPASAFMSGVTAMLFQMASRVCAMTMATYAFALGGQVAEREGEPHPKQVQAAWIYILVLLVGLAVCGAAVVALSSHHTATLDGSKSAIGGPYGFNVSHSLMLGRRRGQLPIAPYNRPAHMLFGAALAAFLQWATMAMPTWPLHPIGLLIVYTYYGTIAWASIFLGWLIKVMLVRYGGSRLYRAAKPFFLGLIVGEVLASIFWCLVPSVLVALGHTYTTIRIQPP